LLTFSVAVVLLLIITLRLDKIMNRFLPEDLIRGFTGAAAITIVVSQLKGILGVKIPPITGTYLIGTTLSQLFGSIKSTNWVSLAIGLSTILMLFLLEKLELFLGSNTFRCFISKFTSPRHNSSDKMNINLPKVLITIFTLTLVSFIYDYNGKYSVSIVGKIKTGIPVFEVPWKVFDMVNPDQKLALLIKLLPHILTIVLVIYCTLKSILQVFPIPEEMYGSGRDIPHGDSFHISQQQSSVIVINYSGVAHDPALTEHPQIDTQIVPTDSIEELIDGPNILENEADQEKASWNEDINELLSLFFANVLCSVGSGFVSSGSLSRSAILATQTQAASPLASFFSSVFVWCAALFLSGGIFHIPMACLSGVVIYALKSTLLKISEGYKIYLKAKHSKSTRHWIEFALWLITFLCVIIWDPSTGIFAGIGFHILLECGFFIRELSIIRN
jgi:MFS superfamily sulfate permease-like transporter